MGLVKVWYKPPAVTAESTEGAVVRRAGVVAFFTLLSRILGYARDAVLANVFGATATFDAFVVAQTVPNFLRRLVAEGALVIAFVPLLSEERQRGGVPAMRAFSGAVVGALIPILVGLVAVGVLFPGFVVDVFAPGFDAERRALAETLTQIMMPYIFFVSLMAVAGGALNVLGSFAAPAAAPILLNVAIIGFTVLARDLFAEPIVAVAWGVTVGGVLQLLLQLPALARRDLLVGPRWAPGDPALRTLLKRMGPAVFGVAVYQINLMVIRQVGSFLPDGQLTCYYSATRLQEFALGVFAVSVSVAALPTLSEHAAAREWYRLSGTFRRALRVTNFVTVPATLALLVLSGPIVGVLFRHGQFSAESARITADLLVILGAALVPIGAVRVAVPTFYALGDTRTPVVGAVVSLLTTVGLGFALGRSYEIWGLTFATSAAAVTQLLVLWAMLRGTLRRRIAEDTAAGRVLDRPTPRAPEPGVVAHALACTLAAAPGVGLAAWLAHQRVWDGGDNVAGALLLFPLIGATVLGYFGCAKLLRIPEADLVLGAVLRRVRRRR